MHYHITVVELALDDVNYPGIPSRTEAPQGRTCMAFDVVNISNRVDMQARQHDRMITVSRLPTEDYVPTVFMFFSGLATDGSQVCYLALGCCCPRASMLVSGRMSNLVISSRFWAVHVYLCRIPLSCLCLLIVHVAQPMA